MVTSAGGEVGRAAAEPFSVGVVVDAGENPALLETVRASIRRVYLWVNAYKPRAGHYTADRTRIRAIDPYFELNDLVYRSMFAVARRAKGRVPRRRGRPMPLFLSTT
ncbi:MAG: hypothetical protein U0736_07420 [Gemmataceae bacterium]